MADAVRRGESVQRGPLYSRPPFICLVCPLFEHELKRDHRRLQWWTVEALLITNLLQEKGKEIESVVLSTGRGREMKMQEINTLSLFPCFKSLHDYCS
jgi:hypothetical protein